jgi:hypothetical protein
MEAKVIRDGWLDDDRRGLQRGSICWDEHRKHAIKRVERWPFDRISIRPQLWSTGVRGSRDVACSRWAYNRFLHIQLPDEPAPPNSESSGKHGRQLVVGRLWHRG